MRFGWRFAAAGIFASALIVGPADAQTTNCIPLGGGGFTCHTLNMPAPPVSQPPQPNGYEALAKTLDENARRRKERQREARDEAAAAQAEHERRVEHYLMASVSKAVVEGRCADARSIALMNNRLDLADQAARLCAPAPRQAQAATAPPAQTYSQWAAPPPSISKSYMEVRCQDGTMFRGYGPPFCEQNGGIASR